MTNYYLTEFEIVFRALGEDVDETLKYVATFWNAVNLKYQELTSPKIKIKVTGIIIEKVIAVRPCFK